MYTFDKMTRGSVNLTFASTSFCSGERAASSPRLPLFFAAAFFARNMSSVGSGTAGAGASSSRTSRSAGAGAGLGAGFLGSLGAALGRAGGEAAAGTSARASWSSVSMPEESPLSTSGSPFPFRLGFSLRGIFGQVCGERRQVRWRRNTH